MSATASSIVLKSRGMPHSNQIRQFLLTTQGIELADVYVGPQGVLTGVERAWPRKPARKREEVRARKVDFERRAA